MGAAGGPNYEPAAAADWAACLRGYDDRGARRAAGGRGVIEVGEKVEEERHNRRAEIRPRTIPHVPSPPAK